MASVMWDIGRLLWLLAILVALVFIPAAIAARTYRPPLVSIAGSLPGTVLVVIAAVSALSPLRLLNPFTLAVACACLGVTVWMLRGRTAMIRDGRGIIRRAILGCVLWWESPRRGEMLPWGARTAAHEFSLLVRRAGNTPAVAVLLTAVVVLAAPRFVEALLNTRLPGPDAYSELITAQRLVSNQSDWTVPKPFAAFAAALSIVSSLAPVHVVRLLPSIVAFATLLTLVLVVYRSGRRVTTAVVAAVVIGVLAHVYPRTPVNEFADLFLVLSLLLWHETLFASRHHGPAAVASTIVAGLAAPTALILLCAAAGIVVLTPRLQRLGFAAVTMVVLVVSLTSRTSEGRYLEYDAAARQSLNLAAAFPKYRFMVVGPIEQWALLYGRGWHMHLHEFVSSVGTHAGDPDYRLPFQVDDVFVFVETRPFAMYDSEPQHVSFPLLTDPVFRHYRSPAGRSSLQFAALEICERLRESVAGASIYYDDGRLRIYRFRL